MRTIQILTIGPENCDDIEIISLNMPNKNSHLNRWLIAGGILLLIIVFVLFVDVKAVLDLLLSTNWLLWLGSVLFLLVGFALTTARWRHSSEPSSWTRTSSPPTTSSASSTSAAVRPRPPSRAW